MHIGLRDGVHLVVVATLPEFPSVRRILPWCPIGARRLGRPRRSAGMQICVNGLWRPWTMNCAIEPIARNKERREREREEKFILFCGELPRK